MSEEPRTQDEYTDRQTRAAHRVLVDLGQVLAAYRDHLVVVGGWVPDLLLPRGDEPHSGSVDVDLALDVEQLANGLYAKLIQSLTKTQRYQQHPEMPFKLYTDVDLEDGGPVIRVDVDFLKPPEMKLRKNKPKLLDDFRPLDADGCIVVFHHPEVIALSGQMVNGAENTVRLRVASIAEFLVMKAYALEGRDKPKDAYDIAFCLGNYPQGVDALAALWNAHPDREHVLRAAEILREKFASERTFGPDRVVQFYNSADPEERAIQAQRAFTLVDRFLSSLKR